MGVPIKDGSPQWAAGLPSQVVKPGYFRELGLPQVSRHYDVAPDGRYFLVIKGEDGASLSQQLVIVQNWFEELKRLVPTN